MIMKKTVKLISALLVFMISIMSLISCGGISPYNNGFYKTNPSYQYYWNEDYAGCIDNIERIKSHGSSFVEAIPVDYKGDLFDMKYCIFTDLNKTDKEAGYFVRHFDKKIEDVSVMCYVFLEDVKLRDLKRSYFMEEYKAYRIIIDVDYAKNHDFNYDGLTADMLECTESYETEDKQIMYKYTLKENNELVLSIGTFKFRNEKLSDEVIQAILDSVDVEAYKYMQE